MTRAFKYVTARASIYAVRHRELGLLCVGKTRYTRKRFRDGHRETQYPLEVVLEMAIAGFLNSKAMTFADCRPEYE